jgi:hypothetical protein
MELGGPHPFFRGKMKGQDSVHQRTLKTKGIIMGEKEETWRKKKKEKKKLGHKGMLCLIKALKNITP